MITLIHFQPLNTQNGTPTITDQDKEHDPNDTDHQNEDIKVQKVFETWKKCN